MVLCGPWSSNINITGEFVRRANPWAPLNHNSGDGTQNSAFYKCLQVILLHADILEL